MQRQMHKYTNRKIQSTLKGECTKDEQDSIILYNSNQLLYLMCTNAMQDNSKNKLNQNLNSELAPPDPGLPPSLHSPGGDSQPLTAEVILILEQTGLKFTSQSGSTFSTTSTSCEPRAVSRGHPSKSL